MQSLREKQLEIINVDNNNSDYLSPDNEEEQTDTTSSYSVQQRLQLIGSITHLMMSSQLHSKYEIVDIADRFVPALVLVTIRFMLGVEKTRFVVKAVKTI